MVLRLDASKGYLLVAGKIYALVNESPNIAIDRIGEWAKRMTLEVAPENTEPVLLIENKAVRLIRISANTYIHNEGY